MTSVCGLKRTPTVYTLSEHACACGDVRAFSEQVSYTSSLVGVHLK